MDLDRNTAIVGAILIVGGLLVTGTISVPDNLSLNALTGDDGGDDLPDGVSTGTSADVSVAVMDSEGEQVSEDIHAWFTDDDSTIYLGETNSETNSDTNSRTEFTSYVVGSEAKFIPFGDTLEYGVEKTKTIQSESELVNLEGYRGASTGNLALTLFDENGDSTGSVSLGAEQQYSFDGLEVEVASSGMTYNPHLIAFDKATETNVSDITVSGAEEVDCPDAIDEYDTCFVAFDATEGEPALGAWESAQTGNIVVEANEMGTNGETLTMAVLDSAPYIADDDTLAYGTGDSEGMDAGVARVAETVTLN